MAEDREVLREVWDGKLPVCFKLAEEEVYTMQQPDPYYCSKFEFLWQEFPEKQLLHCGSRAVVESHFMSAIKEADMLKHRSQVVGTMQKKDHNQLWIGMQNSKFDQFWAINKKLMERIGGECFKHIPFRLYMPDSTLVQRLVSPTTPGGEKATMETLLQQVAPQVLSGDGPQHMVITHGIQVPLETPLQWMSEHLSYPDNFLHLCILPCS
ncbi:hypothetical protein HPB48_010760 [Haemaphysalis longicornis]|uniref:Autophagy protein 5 n=1 Tax=Haemaphysalis longicornis TaxID=44386 RepID=A0A9J6H209_HAELO|nr:hypothetical protein HPB48_010760 [Haemaphysalis longicornis]